MLHSELIEKIDEIAQKATGTQWHYLGYVYVCHVWTALELTAKNGSKCEIRVFCSTALKTETFNRLTPKALQGLQNAKIKNARRGLRNYIIDKYFSARGGCKGYHGYFKFVDLRMIRR